MSSRLAALCSRALSLITLCMLGSSLAPRFAHAAWATDGGAVVTANLAQNQPVLAPDAIGGVFFGWVDARSGFNTDIRAVRWNATGSPVAGWTAGGDNVTAVTCQKADPAATSDGAGGALFAWGDNRCTGFQNVYVRRVAAAGVAAAAWPANGVPMAPTTTNQLTPSITSDGAGGAFVAWQDFRGVDADIYLQHVTSAGAIAAGWPAGGFAVAAVSGVQTAPVVSGDGTGGVFVVWQDRRSGNDDIYAQHVTAAGALASGWIANGLVVCNASGDQRAPSLDIDGSNGFVVAWQDQRAGNWDVYATRVQGDGTIVLGWSANGNALSIASGDQTAVKIVRDGFGGLLAAWQDKRGLTHEIAATRFMGGGTLAAGFTAQGDLLTAAADEQTAPVIASDGASGAYLAWLDRRAGNVDIYASRVAFDGSTPAGWTSGGTLLCGATGDQSGVQLAAAAGGGAFVIWTDPRNVSTSPDLYAHHLLPGGPEQVRPTGLSATHHDGQTYLIWTAPPGTGWTHRIYARSTPIALDSDLDTATLLGSVGDSSATDKRLSAMLNTLCTFRTDSSAAALPGDRGLFVVTPTTDRTLYYAVTSQLQGSSEDRHVFVGSNSLASAVSEFVGSPRPVYQRTVTLVPYTADIYTLWAWTQDTPLVPAIANRPSQPFDCSVSHGASRGVAFMRAHALGGNITQMFAASGNTAEWVLAVEDYTLNNELQTFWYGHHANYDITSNSNLPPLAGPIVDFTNRRILHTLRWFRRTFDFDTTRTYAFGFSLGGTYSLQLAYTHPELFAAVMGSTGKVDYSFQTDPNPNVAYNPGGQYRVSTSRLWGTPAGNLSAVNGQPVYDELNDGVLAARTEGPGSAFHVNFSGKRDETVGWAEKIGFYQSMEAHRTGGVEFWDNRDHSGFVFPGGMAPMLDLRYLYRFRSDLSWPAFAHCSADNDPGNGVGTVGDTLGTLNGYMDWDPALSDSAANWSVTLKTRALSTLWGPLAAPESLTVDVTPRRVQRFKPANGTVISWSATRLSDNALVQSGTVTVDAFGLVTVPGVKTYRTGTRLNLGAPNPLLDATPPHPRPTTLAFGASANPVRGRTSLAMTWPGRDRAHLALYDTNGRLMRTVLDGDMLTGSWQTTIDLSDLAPGVYLMRAEQGGARVSRRVVVLR